MGSTGKRYKWEVQVGSPSKYMFEVQVGSTSGKYR